MYLGYIIEVGDSEEFFNRRLNTYTNICIEEVSDLKEVDKGHFIVCHNWQGIN